MKKRLFISALLFAGILALNGVAFGWGSSGGDGSSFSQLQETAVFFNNSGATRSTGDVVILDTGKSGIVTATTLGSYVTVTGDGEVGSGLADNIKVVGVVLHGAADQRPIVVVTKGPATTTCDDSSDAVTYNSAVGTSGATGARCGGGTNLGIALEPGDGTDADSIRIWVQPTGAD